MNAFSLIKINKDYSISFNRTHFNEEDNSITIGELFIHNKDCKCILSIPDIYISEYDFKKLKEGDSNTFYKVLNHLKEIYTNANNTIDSILNNKI